jgi:hypothetical protein
VRKTSSVNSTQGLHADLKRQLKWNNRIETHKKAFADASRCRDPLDDGDAEDPSDRIRTMVNRDSNVSELILSREAVRDVDRRAIEEFGLRGSS